MEYTTYRDEEPEDKDAIDSLDDSFASDRYWEAGSFSTDQHSKGGGISLMLKQANHPILKTYPKGDEKSNAEEEKEDQEDENWYGLVAVDKNDDAICGVIRARYYDWNKRMAITEFKVDHAFRRQGIGRGLMDEMVYIARTVYRANHVWLEVTNINVPAIEAYQAMGFEICGYDKFLYEGTESEGEFAIYMARSVAVVDLYSFPPKS